MLFKFLKLFFNYTKKEVRISSTSEIKSSSEEFEILEKYKMIQQAKFNYIFTDETPQIVKNMLKFYLGQKLVDLNKMYFDSLERIQNLKKSNDINELLGECLGALNYIIPVIELDKLYNVENKTKSFPCLDYALIYLPLYRIIGQLKNIDDFVNYFNDLSEYRPKVKEAFFRLEVANKIKKFLKLNQKATSKEIFKHINTKDNRFISNTLSYMVKSKILKIVIISDVKFYILVEFKKEEI